MRCMAMAAIIGMRTVAMRSSRSTIFVLMSLHIVVVCASLIVVAQRYKYFHINFDSAYLPDAVLSVAIMSLLVPIFAFARFSFGYCVGITLYTMMLGYIWLSHFTPLQYDHGAARLSAMLSLAALLAPATLLSGGTGRFRFHLSHRVLDYGLMCILAIAAGTLAACAFHVLSGMAELYDMYKMRSGLRYPRALRYLIGITTGALLPFAAACFIVRKNWCLTGIALLLMIAFYPVTFTKITLLAPFWLLFLALLASVIEVRAAVIASLLLPATVGIGLYAVAWELVALYIGTVNFRLLAIPSSAMDHYNAYFATRKLTNFCQVSFLKSLMACPHRPQLGVLMQKVYGLGNFNASLFATEGVASVGLFWAPFSAFVCGLVIVIGNWASRGLPPIFILISSAILVQSLLNTPLSTSLLTGGGAVLFLLWLLTPREALVASNSVPQPA